MTVASYRPAADVSLRKSPALMCMVPRNTPALRKQGRFLPCPSSPLQLSGDACAREVLAN